MDMGGPMPPMRRLSQRMTERVNLVRRQRLSPEAEAIDERAVPLRVGLFEISEKATTLAHQLQEATARMVILDVALEMFGEVGNAFREDGHLHLRRTGVGGAGCVLLDQFLLTSGRDR